jgi:hypothetical protein
MGSSIEDDMQSPMDELVVRPLAVENLTAEYNITIHAMIITRIMKSNSNTSRLTLSWQIVNN